MRPDDRCGSRHSRHPPAFMSTRHRAHVPPRLESDAGTTPTTRTRAQHSSNTNATTRQLLPRSSALVSVIVIRIIGKSDVRVRRLRLRVTPAWEPQVYVERHLSIVLRRKLWIEI